LPGDWLLKKIDAWLNPMKQRQTFLLLLIGWFSLCSCVVQREENAASRTDENFWRGVALADVIYVGETHSDRSNHQYELDLIRGMIRRKLRFAVAWEMFDRSQQPALDRFNEHKMALDDLITETGFQKSWGRYTSMYADILQTTVKARVRNIALNASPELAHKLARGEELSPVEDNQVPKNFTVPEGAYQNFVEMLRDHPGLQSGDLSRFFAAQNLWDQTMAKTILEFRQSHPKTKLIVLAGRDHVKGGYGIPNYVAQKSSAKQLVLFPPSANDVASGRKAI
jgi:uncharacterized iron-regulated protein